MLKATLLKLVSSAHHKLLSLVSFKCYNFGIDENSKLVDCLTAGTQQGVGVPQRQSEQCGLVA